MTKEQEKEFEKSREAMRKFREVLDWMDDEGVRDKIGILPLKKGAPEEIKQRYKILHEISEEQAKTGIYNN